MKVIPLSRVREKTLVKEIKNNSVFIYPTDTVYGIGCNALDEEAVERVRQIKNTNKPFSVIAPSKQWIYKNLHAKKHYIEKLPGPFTFIIKLKKKNIVASNVTYNNTLGIRIPNNKLTKLIQKSKLPFISTSANESGKPPIIDVNKLPRRLENVDIVIDAGLLENKSSAVIDITGKIARIIR